jgi:hypothetical protein
VTVTAAAERICLGAAAVAACALLAYAVLQIGGAVGVVVAPAGAIPLFWRLKEAAVAAGMASPLLWWVAGAPRAVRARGLAALLAGAAGAVALCAVIWP